MGISRLFVCAWPDADTVARLVEAAADLTGESAPGIRRVPPAELHVTLRFLGSADAEAVDEALRGIVLAPADVTVGPRVELLDGHSLVVPAEGLEQWSAAVHRATAGLGGAPARERFVGHITLARRSSAHRRQRRALPGLLGRPVAGRFRASEWSLVHSALGPNGPRYETLATYAAGH